MSSIAVSSSSAASSVRQPTQSDLRANLDKLSSKVKDDIASGKLSGDSAKAASAQVKTLNDSFSALAQNGALRQSDVAALNQRVSSQTKILAQSADAQASSTTAPATAAAKTTTTAKAPTTQAEVGNDLRKLREDLGSAIAKGTLTGDAAKAATEQVQKLTSAFSAQSTKGGLSTDQVADFGKQIAAANSKVTASTDTTTNAANSTTSSATSGSTNSTSATTSTSTSATTTTSATSSTAPTNSTTAAAKTSSAASTSTSATSSTSTTTSQTVSPQLQAAKDALAKLTEINNAGTYNASGGFSQLSNAAQTSLTNSRATFSLFA